MCQDLFIGSCCISWGIDSKRSGEAWIFYVRFLTSFFFFFFSFFNDSLSPDTFVPHLGQKLCILDSRAPHFSHSISLSLLLFASKPKLSEKLENVKKKVGDDVCETRSVGFFGFCVRFRFFCFWKIRSVSWRRNESTSRKFAWCGIRSYSRSKKWYDSLSLSHFPYSTTNMKKTFK